MESAHRFVLVELRSLLHLQGATVPGECLGIVAKRASAAAEENERDVREEELAGEQKRVLDVRRATPELALQLPKEDNFWFRDIPLILHSEFENGSGEVEMELSGNEVERVQLEQQELVEGAQLELELEQQEQVHARVVFWGNPSILE